MFCKTCNVMMHKVLSCDDGKFYTYHRCPRCYFQTKRYPYQFEDSVECKNAQNNNRKKRRGNKSIKRT